MIARAWPTLPFRTANQILWLLLAGYLLLGSVRVIAASPASAIVSDSLENYKSPTDGLGWWIWAEVTTNEQTVQLWKAFVVPESMAVTNARLLMTVDNEFTLYLDGRELGRGAEWRELFDFDLTPLMSPGRHILAVRAYNSAFAAGMIFGLQIVLADGRVIRVKSDPSWRIVPDGVSRWEKRTQAGRDWPSATVVGSLGVPPRWETPDNVDKMPPLRPVKIHFWQTGWFQITLLSICGVVILISLRLMAQLALHQKERWLLQQERARIAREIHDDIGSRMTQLVLHGEVAQNGLMADSETSQQLAQICEEARGLLLTMDEILWAVNPRRDTLRDFAAYVCNYAQAFLKSTSIQCLFEVDEEMSAAAFDLPLRRSLLMAIKEALNNAVKYSGASELLLQIHWRGPRLIVVVEDNGKGFDTAVTKLDRNGLTNMTQRMEELGGSCLVATQPGKGCRIEFNVPLKRPRKGPWGRLWNPKDYSAPVAGNSGGRSAKSPQNHDPANC